jgi:hypothetical protein
VSTGPTNDHTYGTRQGWYAFIETSAPRAPNDTARLVSPPITDNQARWLVALVDTVCSVLNGHTGKNQCPLFSSQGGNAQKYTVLLFVFLDKTE